jgi:N-acetylglutamate synthase
MTHVSLAWRVEEACLNALPSSRQVLLDRWLIRLSGGPIRRMNSVNPLKADVHDPAPIVAIARRLYHAQKQQMIFRVPSIARGMDASLERLNFAVEGGTCALLADFSQHKFIEDHEVRLAVSPSAEWLAARVRLLPVSHADHQIFQAAIEAIALPKGFASIAYSDQVVAIAYGVIHDALLVVESVMTDREFRQRGFGRRIVERLMNWAFRQGAGSACLQVVADNLPARALYRKLGFRTELYRYHYRREQTNC